LISWDLRNRAAAKKSLYRQLKKTTLTGRLFYWVGVEGGGAGGTEAAGAGAGAAGLSLTIRFWAGIKGGSVVDLRRSRIIGMTSQVGW